MPYAAYRSNKMRIGNVESLVTLTKAIPLEGDENLIAVGPRELEGEKWNQIISLWDFVAKWNRDRKAGYVGSHQLNAGMGEVLEI